MTMKKKSTMVKKSGTPAKAKKKVKKPEGEEEQLETQAMGQDAQQPEETAEEQNTTAAVAVEETSPEPEQVGPKQILFRYIGNGTCRIRRKTITKGQTIELYEREIPTLFRNLLIPVGGQEALQKANSVIKSKNNFELRQVNKTHYNIFNNETGVALFASHMRLDKAMKEWENLKK